MSNILLIEPDRTLALTYQKALTLNGFRTKWCASIQDAIHILVKRTFAAIVLELQLPRHNGIEFLYEYRSYPEWQNTPVILHTIVSSHTLIPSREILEDLGVKRYLYKPETSLTNLISTINEVLGK